jgi:hypothetical protein
VSLVKHISRYQPLLTPTLADSTTHLHARMSRSSSSGVLQFTHTESSSPRDPSISNASFRSLSTWYAIVPPGINCHPHLLIVSQADMVVEFQADERDGHPVMMAAISYIYGFDIPGEPTPWFITTLYYLSWLGTVAEKYEIPGLSETVLKAAHRALVDGSRDEAKLEQFLCYSELLAESTCSSKNPGHFAFAVRILGQHLTAIRTNAAFQRSCQLTSSIWWRRKRTSWRKPCKGLRKI